MALHRFFISADNIQDGYIYITGPDAEHMHVLRLRPGELVAVCDGEDTDYICEVESSDKREARLKVLETKESVGEPTVLCAVYTAYPKGDKAESIVQKSVELGASEIVFFPSERCVSKPDAASAAKKRERWQKIAEEAAKQSGRGRIPAVRIADSFDMAVKDAALAELPLFLYEKETVNSIKNPLFEKGSSVKTISVMTGSEGGFEGWEAEKAKSAGMLCVSIGKRILRCETAPLAALSAVMLCTGNF